MVRSQHGTCWCSLWDGNIHIIRLCRTWNLLEGDPLPFEQGDHCGDSCCPKENYTCLDASQGICCPTGSTFCALGECCSPGYSCTPRGACCWDSSPDGECCSSGSSATCCMLPASECGSCCGGQLGVSNVVFVMEVPLAIIVIILIYDSVFVEDVKAHLALAGVEMSADRVGIAWRLRFVKQ